MQWKEQGSNFEKEFSLSFHSSHCPVLISSLLLRSLPAGQIDMAGLKKKPKGWFLILYELKSGTDPSPQQWVRLRRAQDYLSKILEMETKLEVKFCKNAEP